MFKIIDVSEQIEPLFMCFAAAMMVGKATQCEGERMKLMRAQRDQLFEYGPFTIRRQRPGEALGPLAIIDQMTLKMDARIPMHTHKDDEIFSYVWRGSAQHHAEEGETIALNAKRTLLVSAGSGVRYEASAPFIETEMLQAYIRPAYSGGEPRTRVFSRDEPAPLNEWTLLAGPEAEDVPLALRQDVFIYDLKIERDAQVAVPHREGYSTWLTLLDGIVRVGDTRLLKGDALTAPDILPAVTGERDAVVIAFLVRDAATSVTSGTVSGA